MIVKRLVFKAKNSDYFRQYITEDLDRYLRRKRRENCHGNHIEMIAIAEMYNRPIEVYEYTTGTLIFSCLILVSIVCNEI